MELVPLARVVALWARLLGAARGGVGRRWMRSVVLRTAVVSWRCAVEQVRLVCAVALWSVVAR
ncbi:hypothetical protein [Amycolatopsis mediterranei]|uniref:hypothetical protein n=1 Tax=Amycolatopsis mediterranei TaxID=33910 RepID=UPI00114CB960|nr:hypothetical protein [Amycolatopsis mediterranei]UZF68292.1 hypothetical protein ISP_001352 [Amycolatopsis mediterranei]